MFGVLSDLLIKAVIGIHENIQGPFIAFLGLCGDMWGSSEGPSQHVTDAVKGEVEELSFR